jgi:hypothetical protein
MCHHRALASSLATCALGLAVASDGAQAASWESIPTFSGTITIEMETLGPSSQIVGATGAWVRYSPSLSVDCSPPRGCYAATQRLHYVFNCMPRYIILMERTSFDLGGTTLKHEHVGSHAVANDEAAKRLLTAFCGAWDNN